jgi:orotidine-5'-phosphate decarboxylase
MVPWILDELKKRKINIWLDWKWKDIPRTVEGFVIGAVMRGVSMITIHSDGGLEMIKYATEAVNIAKEMNGSSRPKVLAVSVLTSINDKILNEELDISGEVVDRVRHYAFLAQEGGVDGIVASAREAPVLRRDLDPKMLIVTPGIKPKWAAKNVDQKRITTPYEAIKNGSTHLVVGSAIIKAEKYGKTRAEAAEDIIAEIQKAMDEE